MLTGKCLCGAVRFEITQPLGSARYCHCTRCQRRTGTGSSAQADLRPGSLQLLAGEDLVRWWWPPEGFGKAFCSACGSALFSRRSPDEPVAAVRLGVLDGDPGVRPSVRQHTGTAAVWEPIPDDGLPRHEGARPAEVS